MKQNIRLYSALFLILGFILYGINAEAVPGQRYFGDGASSNPSGTWDYSLANDGHCLVCHVPDSFAGAPDKTSYLMTGHKNAMRKATFNSPWAGPDSLIYATDSSGHAILWNMLGTTLIGNSATYPPLLDGACSILGYPDATSCAGAGGSWTSTSQSLFYIYGGWMYAPTLPYNQPGSSLATPGSVANGDSFNCARCHTTGVTLDTALSTTRPPEKTYPGINTYVNFDPDGNGPASFISWATNTTTGRTLEGVQCDRCHDATLHKGGNGPAVVLQGVSATALCLECHRQEHIVSYTGGGLGSNIHPTPIVDNPGIPASEPTVTLPFIEVGGDAGYAPQFYGFSIGNQYLNSVHAEFTGNFQQINDSSKYLSYFITSPVDGGCTKCHDVHQSTVAEVNATAPFKNNCPTCHIEGSPEGVANNLHPKGPLTPFDDMDHVEKACYTCHMPRLNDGSATHIWRIKSDASYTTFPTEAEWNAGQKTAYTAPTVTHSYSNAVWLDIDIVCGQCHGSSSGSASGIPQYPKTLLAQIASGIHSGSISGNGCLICHSSQMGAQDPVKPGVNHHSGPCTECHGTATWPLHQGVPAPPCMSCHNSPQTESATGNTLPAIVPGTFSNITGKNHHGMVPGETAECIECHGTHGGIPATFNGISYTVNTMCLACHTEAAFGTGIPFIQGTNHHNGQCVSCHDPANPLDFAKVTGPGVLPVVSTCTGCHTTFSLSTMNHPVLPGTPTSCQTCHAYSKILSGQTTSTYYSWPGVVPTDTDHVCGQCHGGSSGITANGAPYFSAGDLANYAVDIHRTRPLARFTWTNDPVVDFNVQFDASSSICPSGSCTYTWNFGDSTSGSGITTSHVYSATPTSFTATLTINSAGNTNTSSQTVTPKYVGATPTKLTINTTTSGMSTNLTYSVSGGFSPYTVQIIWGDGALTTLSNVSAGQSTTTHVYSTGGNFNGSVSAVDSGVNGSNKTTATATFSVTTTLPSVSGTVTRSNGTTPISNVYLYLQQNGATKKIVVTNTSGNYSFTNVANGSYTIQAVRSGYVFANPAASITVSGATITGLNIRSITP